MSYYDDLGVSRTATKDEITSAYRKIQKQYHPDVYKGEDTEFASEKVKAANAAYDVLGDEYKRSEYDRKLNAGAFDEPFGDGFGSYGHGQGSGFYSSGFYYNPFGSQGNPYTGRQSGTYSNSYSNSNSYSGQQENSGSNPYTNPYTNPYSSSAKNNTDPFSGGAHHYKKSKNAIRLGGFGRIALRLVIWFLLFRFIGVFARIGLPFFFFF